MKKQVQDERIIEESRKQNSLGFTILYFGLLLDLLYRQFILMQPISEYWDLALLFFGTAFYLTAKRVGSGLYASNVNLKSIILGSVVATIVNSGVNYWYLGNTELLELLIGGVTFFVCFISITLLMQYFSQKKNKEILKDD